MGGTRGGGRPVPGAVDSARMGRGAFVPDPPLPVKLEELSEPEAGGVEALARFCRAASPGWNGAEGKARPAGTSAAFSPRLKAGGER